MAAKYFWLHLKGLAIYPALAFIPLSMRALLCGLVLCCTTSKTLVAQNRPVPADTVAAHIQLPGADCGLFPAAARLPNFLDYYVTRTGRFTPTLPQAIEVEQALPTAQLQKLYEHPITSYYAAYPVIIKQHLPEYQRQYYGFYNELHQPCLFINFFIEHIESTPNTVPNWLCYYIHTHDGGAAFWSIYYNLTTHKFYRFSHNLEG
jgi:hypothetical protein